MSKSIIQTEKRCYVTGSTHDLHKHHVYAGGRRKLSEKYGCWVWLRSDWHNMAPYGVHGIHGHELDMELKRVAQRKFEAIHGHEKFMAVFGKNYL